MRRHTVALRGRDPAAAILAVLLAVHLVFAAETPEKPPADLGLVERATSRLQQIDVTLSGPSDALAGLGAADFQVWVNNRAVSGFTVDRVCQEPSEEPAAEIPTNTAALSPARPTPQAPRPSATYVFYFDHGHMTQGGRMTAIDLAIEIAPRLMAGGGRAMILSNAQELRTYLPLTADAARVAAALGRLRTDVKEWDTYAAEEESRVSDVLRALGSSTDSRSNVELALTLAKGYQLEERWRQERDLRRLEMILGRLADLDAPKAVLYFADNMRANAGEHYLSFFGTTTIQAAASGRGVESSVVADAASAQLNLDRVVNEAAALGIRFYTVEATGLAGESLNIASKGGAASLSVSSTPSANTQRHRDAQDTLGSMALETGGRAFLNGVPGPKVAQRIVDDLSCVYLISFDPRGYPKDTPLPVTVKVARAKVKVQCRGRIVIQGDSRRLTSRLLASFAAPEATRSDVPIRIGLVPVGYKGGAFQARVQIVVPATPVAGATWDLGASVVSRGKVSEDMSGRVEVPTAGVPIVLESEMSFGAGPFELVAVVHESVSDQLASKKLDGAWPSPDDNPVTLAPIGVVQPANAAFLRGGEKRASGNVALGEGDFLRSDQPTAILGLVCRSKDQKQPLTVERVLEGETPTRFPATTIPFVDTERCAQFRDLIPPGTLGEGRYTYKVRVTNPSGTIAETERTILVAPKP